MHTKYGRKRAWKDAGKQRGVAFRRHMRAQVAAGFGHSADGSPRRLDDTSATGRSLVAGYRLGTFA